MSSHAAMELVRILLDLHNRNSRSWHWASPDREVVEPRDSTMPVTAFVNQYFVYNSIYQINWAESAKTGDVVPVRTQKSEKASSQDEQQARVNFIQTFGRKGLTEQALIEEWEKDRKARKKKEPKQSEDHQQRELEDFLLHQDGSRMYLKTAFQPLRNFGTSIKGRMDTD